ncbi:hypothetical protein BURC_03736 [Burkholderiaceae bacterium]|nr:hypothetical protein BURC_03736 [Burkholderiaceae bacterium]
MDFSKRQADPRRHLVGITFVILFHAFIVYALVTGLATKVVEVVRAPIETKVIEEIKKPPPPPEVVVPPPPKMEAPPPPFIPPPEVQIQQPPPQQQPTITVQQTTPPPPQEFRPTPPVVAVAPPAPPAPVSAGVVCSNYATVMGEVAYPREAIRLGIDKGEALVQFTVGSNGAIKDVKVLKSTHAIFARNSVRIVGDYKCQGQGRDVLVQVPFGYKLE